MTPRDGAHTGESPLVAALLRAEAYPHLRARPARGEPAQGAPPRIELLQTHISWLFFAGDLVYKVKRPVDRGFLDFTTLGQRRAACEAELRLNRRLAPATYRRVVPVTRESDGAIRIDGGGETIDWAVEMDRLPADRMLDRLLERGAVDNELVESLAALLSAFHRDAPTGPGVDEHGAPDAVAAHVRDVLSQLERFADAAPVTLSRTLHGFLAARCEDFVRTRRALLERRVAAGRVREGHGDLHAGNICDAPGGLVVYDCIEFSAALRCGDVACDLAFLAMDLDARGFRGFARYLVRRYASLSGDAELPELLGFYKTYRALVRAMVASLQLAEADDDDERAIRLRDARRYAHLAASYQLPAALVLTCGLPGSGKSWLAQHLAEPFEAPVLRSDVRRKQLAGLPPTADAEAEFGAGLYTPESIEHTYQVLLDEAISHLEHGRTVLVDATFSRARHRRRFLDAAVRLGHPVALLHLETPDAVIRERLARRSAAARTAREHGRPGGDASDADVAVYERALASFEPPDEVHPSLRVAAPHDEPPEAVVAHLIDGLVRQAAGA